MRAALSIIILLFFINPATALVPKDARPWNLAQINWHTYYSGLKKARKENKPILIVFHTSWCPQCKVYKRQFYDAEVVKLSRKFVFILVDQDRYKRLGRKYAPDGRYIPRTMVLNSRGRLDKRIHGGYRKYKWFLAVEKPGDLVRILRMGVRKYGGR